MSSGWWMELMISGVGRLRGRDRQLWNWRGSWMEGGCRRQSTDDGRGRAQRPGSGSVRRTSSSVSGSGSKTIICRVPVRVQASSDFKAAFSSLSMDHRPLQSTIEDEDDEAGGTKHSSVQDLPSWNFIDIGSNLGDPVFRGEYDGKQVHSDDFHQVLSRARSAGVAKQILTGDCLMGSQQVKELAHQNEGLYATVGCHPCRANEFEANANRDSKSDDLEESLIRSAGEYLNGLDRLIADDLASDHPRVVAVGECGLDYDRLSHCSKEIQLRYFPPQLELATKYKLPLFLHSRTSEAHVDFVRILREHEATHSSSEILPARKKGVVHSFTGTLEEMHELIELGLSIGVNGCSLKTDANLEVVKAIPLDRIMLETDCPWCEIRPSHASHAYLAGIPHPERFLPGSIKKEKYRAATEDHRFKIVKGRNEPCTIGQVAWIVSQLKAISLEVLVEHAWKNSIEMFGLS